MGLLDDKLPFLEKVAQEYSKKTGAQIRELVNMAIIFAVDEKSYDDNKQLIITEEHFKSAMHEVAGKDFKQSYRVFNRKL
jgi:ATP-dependent 26S proteasome regulatory subunit